MQKDNELFLACWRSLPRKERLPRKSDLDLRRLQSLLVHMVVVEVQSADFLRIRLAGTELGQRWKLPLTGRNYLDMVPEAARRATARDFQRMLEWPCGMLSQRQDHYPSGRQTRIETLVLPFLDSGDRAAIAVGVVVPMDSRWRIDDALWQPGLSSPLAHEFVDLGHGVPERPAKAQADPARMTTRNRAKR